MAQWEKLTTLFQNEEDSEFFNQLNQFYTREGFSMSLREDFANWIEKQNWDSPDILISASDILQGFLDEMKKFARSKHVPFVKKQEYQKEIKSYETVYSSDPTRFVQVMQRCLKAERELLNSRTLPIPDEQPMHLSPDVSLRQRTEGIQQNVRGVDMTINLIEMLRESVVSNTNKRSEYGNALEKMGGNQERKANVETAIQQLQKNIDRETMDLTHKYAEISMKEKNMIQDIVDVATEMIDEHLNRWKVFQKHPPLKHAPNAMKTIPLDSFENLFSEIFELLILIKQQLTRYYKQAEKALTFRLNIWKSDAETHAFIASIQEYIDEANKVIKKLFNNCIVIEEQPPQIIKVDTKSGKSREMRVLLRCLLNGSHFLNFGEVTTEFRNEQELSPSSMTSNKKATKATISNGVGKFTIANKTHSLLFERLRVEGFRRTGMDEVVTEQKYGLRFCVDIQLSQMKVPIKVISLPIIVCCHTSQECSAQASILWYNAFSTMDSKPYEVDRSVPWDQFKQILDLELQSKMAVDGRPGKGFSEENFECIREMFGVDPNDDSATVSWEKFNKELLPPKNKFSFWKWFSGTINLINVHFRNVWNDGLVHGYLSKDQAAAMLSNSAPGTFALRFSSSYIDTKSVPSAGLSVILVVRKQDGGTDLIHCQPFTSREHFSRHIDEGNFGTMLKEFLVSDEFSLMYLYPDIPIEQAFAKYIQADDGEYDPESYDPVSVSFKVRPHNNHMMRTGHRLSSMSEGSSIASPAPSHQSSQMEFDTSMTSPQAGFPLSPQSTISNMSEVVPRTMGQIMRQNSNPADEVAQLIRRMSNQPIFPPMGTNQNNSANFTTFDHQQPWVPESANEVTVETRIDDNGRTSSLNIEAILSNLHST